MREKSHSLLPHLSAWGLDKAAPSDGFQPSPFSSRSLSYYFTFLLYLVQSFQFFLL